MSGCRLQVVCIHCGSSTYHVPYILDTHQHYCRVCLRSTRVVCNVCGGNGQDHQPGCIVIDSHIIQHATTLTTERGLSVPWSYPACDIRFAGSDVVPHHFCRTNRFIYPTTGQPSNHAILGSNPPWCCGCGIAQEGRQVSERPSGAARNLAEP